MRVLFALAALLTACAEPGSKGSDRAGQDSGSDTLGTAALGGTPTGSSSSSTTPEDGEIEVGNGEQQHQPAAPGQPVIAVHGPQGGWHVEVSGMVEGLGQVVGLEVWVERLDTKERIAVNGDQPTALALAGYDAVARTGWFAGERAYVDATSLEAVCPLEGVPLQMCASAEDLAEPGHFATGCVEVVGALDPADVGPCATVP